MLEIVNKITNGEMCDLCDGGWHELSKVRLEGDQLHASVLCVESGNKEHISLPIPKA